MLPGSCVESILGDLVIDTLEPQESVRLNPLLVKTSAACQKGDLAEITAKLNYESAVTSISLTTKKQFFIGNITENFSEHNDIGQAIPDMGDPVEFSFAWNKPGTITDVAIALDLTHTFIGDLRVKLIHPDGTEIFLHNNEGSAMNDLNRIYGRGGQSLQELRKLVGKKAEGIWKLVVSDHARSDVGTLNNLKLNLWGYFRE